jgi:acyl dehydratase
MSEPRTLSVTFSEEQIAGYAEASGDHNPIHVDEAFARSVGLPGIIAHGMLQMGLLARVAAPAGHSLTRLSCRFAAMVAPGDTVMFTATDGEDGHAALTAVNQRGEAVLTKAQARYR